MATLNFASTKKGSTAAGRSSSAQKRVEALVRLRCAEELLSGGEGQLIVMEVNCADPDCVPIETVAILVKEIASQKAPGAELDAKEDKSDGKWIGRIFKPIAEVIDNDINMLALPVDLNDFRVAAEKQKEIERLEMNRIKGFDGNEGKISADKETKTQIEEKNEEEIEVRNSDNRQEGELVRVMVDDGWTGTRPVMVRRLPQRPKFSAPDANDGVPGKHKKGKAPTGCPCCDPDMFDLMMTKPPI